MRYLNANVFIYAALYSGKKADHAREILKEMVEGKGAITSTLTIDEVVWVVWKESNREKAIKEGVRLLELPNLKVLSVDVGDTYLALNLMNKYQKLNPRDAIHLAVSLRAGVYRIISDDSDFDEVGEIVRERL